MTTATPNSTGSDGLLHGRHAVVTGAARGIGRAVAVQLLAHGATVTLVGRDAAALREASAALGPRADDATADVTDGAAVQTCIDQVLAVHRRLDFLINNAGAAESAPIQRTDSALWQRMLDINLTGTYHCIRAALPALLQTGAGRIVNVASSAGQVGYPYVAAYCAAKHGVIGLTRALALELATKSVTVNAVCPGYTDTEIVRASITNIVARTGRSEADALATLVAHNPQRRLIRPEEVANAVLWLCLPGSDSVTGQSISVSGGEIA